MWKNISAFRNTPDHSIESLINAATIAANNLIQFYDGYRIGGTIGMFQAPVYWWEAGACWDVCDLFGPPVLALAMIADEFRRISVSGV